MCPTFIHRHAESPAKGGSARALCASLSAAAIRDNLSDPGASLLALLASHSQLGPAR
jgi:hypothetical protein